MTSRRFLFYSLTMFSIVALLSTSLVPLTDAHTTEIVTKWGIVGEEPIYDYKATYENGKLVASVTKVGMRNLYGHYTEEVVLGSHNHWPDYVSAAGIAIGGALIGAAATIIANK